MAKLPLKYQGPGWVVARQIASYAGRVVSAQTEQPLPGALVTLSDAEGIARQCRCAADGSFVFRNLQAGTYTRTVEPPDASGRYQRSTSVEIALLKDGSDNPVPLIEEFGLQATRLVGTVMHSTEPLAGAMVRADGGGSAITDDKGRFAIYAIPADTMSVTILARGYRTNTSTQTLLAGAATTLDVTLEPLPTPSIT